MNENWVGVWIDHRNAFIVRPADEGCSVTTVSSDIERHITSTGGRAKPQPYMHENAPVSGAHRDRAYDNKLEKYLMDVVTHLDNAGRIFLLGPGIVKERLKRLIVSTQSKAHSFDIVVEASEQMTLPQLKETVMSHFKHPAQRFFRDAPGAASHSVEV